MKRKKKVKQNQFSLNIVRSFFIVYILIFAIKLLLLSLLLLPLVGFIHMCQGKVFFVLTVLIPSMVSLLLGSP